MNIKSLLLGSAAALAVVSGAQAADAIVAAEPEPAEYVRVCDAFGTGYFYIPGTETCLKIGGYVRFQADFSNATNKAAVNFNTIGDLQISANTDTELGALSSYIEVYSSTNDGSVFTGDGVVVDAAYLDLAGFRAGLFYGYFDDGLAGETDSLSGQTRYNSVAYTFSSDAFTAGVALDEINEGAAGANNDFGVEGKAGFKSGAFGVTVYGGYDFSVEEGSIKAIASADVGIGSLQLGAQYNTGANTYAPGEYTNTTEWAIAASFAAKVSDKLTLTPGVNYTETYAGVNDWTVGLTADYAITDGLSAKAYVSYKDSTDVTSGFFRLQRSF